AAARSGAVSAPAPERSAEPYDAAVDHLVALAGPVSDRRAFAHHLAFLELDMTDPDFGAIARDTVAAVLGHLQALGLSAAEARRLYIAYNGALVLWALAGDGPLEVWLRTELVNARNNTR